MSNKKYTVSIPASWLCAHEMENCDVDATYTHYCEQCKLMLELNMGIDADVKIGGKSLGVTQGVQEVTDELYEWVEAVCAGVPPIYIVKGA